MYFWTLLIPNHVPLTFLYPEVSVHVRGAKRAMRQEKAESLILIVELRARDEQHITEPRMGEMYH